MKKHLALVLVICLLAGLMAPAALAETAFDVYGKSFEDSKLEIKKLLPLTSTLVDMQDGNPTNALGLIACAWTNLANYEMNVQGKALKDTLAAEIYQKVKEGPCVVCLVATAADADIQNVLIAANSGSIIGSIYWFELDTKANTMRFFHNPYGSEAYAEDVDFLSDYGFNSYIKAAAGGTAFMGGVPAGAVLMAFGASQEIYHVFDQIYEKGMGEKLNIK